MNKKKYGHKLKGMNVCASGFEPSVLQTIREKVEKFQGTFNENMLTTTNVLISDKINSSKSLAARDRKIPIVTKDWILVSKNPPENEKYKIKCFHGLRISLIGFEPDMEFSSIRSAIEENTGIIDQNCEESDVIVIKSSIITSKYDESLIEKFDMKLVTEKWVNQCMQDQMYISVTDPNFKIKTERLISKFDFYEKEILNEDHMAIDGENDPPAQPASLLSIFNDLIFFISPEFAKDVHMTIMRFISLGSGIAYSKLSPLTTHIICNSNKDSFSSQSMSFGKFYKPTLVNPNWLLTCITERRLVSTEEFRPNSSFCLMRDVDSQNSELHFNAKIISNLLKNETFFINSDSYSKEEYALLKEKILSHSGTLTEPNSFINTKTIKAKYIIVNDAFSQTQLKNLIENRVQNHQLIVSHRFIDMCIEKRKVIDFQEFHYIHLFPFHFAVPFNDFLENGIEIYLCEYSYSEKIVLEYLIETLGGKVDLSTNTTHLMCRKGIDVKKFEKIKAKSNQNLKVISEEWLLDCVIEGKIVKEDKYSVEVQVGTSPQK